MSLSPDNPLFINPNSSVNPWQTPLLALSSQFYPSVPFHATIQLYVISGFFVIYMILTIAGIALRLQHNPVRFFAIRAGYFVPNTSSVYLVFIFLWLIAAQAQIWRQVSIYRDNGGYRGVYIARTLSWLPLSVSGWTQVHGLFLGTCLNISHDTFVSGSSRSTAPQLTGSLSKTQNFFSFKSSNRGISSFPPGLLNTIAFGLPISFCIPVLGFGIASETVCTRTFNDFQASRHVAMEGGSIWDAQHTVSQSSLMEWYSGILKISKSNCAKFQRIEYSIMLSWVFVLLVSSNWCFTILRHKLTRQIQLLKRAAQTFRGAQEHRATPGFSINATPPLNALHPPEQETLSPPGTKDGISRTASSLSTTSQRQPGFEKDFKSSTSVHSHEFISSGDFTRSRQPTAARQPNSHIQALKKRAEGLQRGLDNLYWHWGILDIAATCYFVNCLLIVVKGGYIQTNGKWSVAVNLAGLYIWLVIGGGAITLLFVVGIKPERRTYLGIPVQPVASPSTPSSNSSLREPKGSQDEEPELVGFHGQMAPWTTWTVSHNHNRSASASQGVRRTWGEPPPSFQVPGQSNETTPSSPYPLATSPNSDHSDHYSYPP